MLSLFDGHVCVKCGAWKPVGEYYRYEIDRNGLTAVCKACKRAGVNLRGRVCPPLADDADDATRRAHVARLQMTRRDARRATPKHPHRWGLSAEEKRAYNNARQVQHGNTRRARKAGAGGSFTAAEWKALCVRYGNECLCCKLIKPLVADHVIPLSRSGSNSIANIQPLCRSCNARKGVKTTDYR